MRVEIRHRISGNRQNQTNCYYHYCLTQFARLSTYSPVAAGDVNPTRRVTFAKGGNTDNAGSVYLKVRY
jgi:hypothetical protein